MQVLLTRMEERANALAEDDTPSHERDDTQVDLDAKTHTLNATQCDPCPCATKALFPSARVARVNVTA